MRTFTGVVLAGGVSRRMGQDKALLNIGADTMLDHTINLLRLAGASKTVVLGRGNGPNDVPDKHPHQGPAVALVDFLATQPRGSRHLVVPLDMPNLSVKILAELVRQSGWAYFESYPLPCLAIAGLAPSQFSRKIRGLQLKAKAKPLPVPPSSHHCFTNINTPQDYNELSEMQYSSGALMDIGNIRPRPLTSGARPKD